MKALLFVTLFVAALSALAANKEPMAKNVDIGQVATPSTQDSRVKDALKGAPPACECSITPTLPGGNDQYGLKVANCTCPSGKGDMACVIAVPITKLGGLGAAMHCQ